MSVGGREVLGPELEALATFAKALCKKSGPDGPRYMACLAKSDCYSAASFHGKLVTRTRPFAYVVLGGWYLSVSLDFLARSKVFRKGVTHTRGDWGRRLLAGGVRPFVLPTRAGIGGWRNHR